MKGNYICTFDGTKTLSFYDKNDKSLKKNLIDNRNKEMDDLELRCKAFIQDYMDRVVAQKMYAK